MPYMPEGREEIRAAATVKTADDSRFGLTTMPPFYGDDDLGYTMTGEKRWPKEVVDALWDIVEDGRELTDQDRYNYLEKLVYGQDRVPLEERLAARDRLREWGPMYPPREGSA